MKYFIIFILLFSGCAIKQPIKTSSATILFKTPFMKFYDKGFISKYDDKIELNILNAGQTVLHLEIYKDQVCKSTFKCIDSKKFNEKYLHKSYSKQFLYKLFSSSKIKFKDKKNHILIKVIPD